MSLETAFALVGSKDPQTGEVFFPARALSVDGALRELERVPLSLTGVLYSFAVVGNVTYGLIDLPDGVRLQSELAPGEPVIDGTYRITGDEGSWRFARA